MVLLLVTIGFTSCQCFRGTMVAGGDMRTYIVAFVEGTWILPCAVVR